MMSKGITIRLDKSIRLGNVECRVSVEPFPDERVARLDLEVAGVNVVASLSRANLLRLSDGLRVAALALPAEITT